MNPQARLEHAAKPAEEALRLHPCYKRKMETAVKCRVRDFDDFAIGYSPGVAAVGRMAQKQGLARRAKSEEEHLHHATTIIRRSRALTDTMMKDGSIAPS